MERIIYVDRGQRVPEIWYAIVKGSEEGLLADRLVSQRGWGEWKTGEKELKRWMDEVRGLLTYTDISSIISKMRRQLEDRMRKNSFLCLEVIEAIHQRQK
jgi:hypothetical protein